MDLRVVGVRLLPGFSAGLVEPTALVEVSYRGEVGDGGGAEDRLRAGVGTLCPERPLYRVGVGDWPQAFLMREPAGPEVAAPVRLGQWVVALAVGLQQWARFPVWRGRVVSAEQGLLRLAVPWYHEEYSRRLFDVAAGLVGQWWGADPDPVAVSGLVGRFREVLDEARPQRQTPRMWHFVRAAVERDIPFRLVPNGVRFGWGAQAEQLYNCYTGKTGVIAAATAQNKAATKELLARAGVPVPSGRVVADVGQALSAAAELGWPVVVKPAHLDKGVAVSPGIADEATLREAYQRAADAGGGAVIVEKHIDGEDHRILVVEGRVVAAAHRVPAGVIGDGVHTVAELIDIVNADPLRSVDPSAILTTLTIDASIGPLLGEQGLGLDAVPEAGRSVVVSRTANMSTGGVAADVSDVVHPDNRLLAERAVRVLGLDIAGVDFLTPDISRSWHEVGGAICEINDQPGFQPQWIANPHHDISGEVFDVVMKGRSPRIPTAAITGTNGKTTTASMLHHIWMTAGRVAGVCTTAGVRIGTEVVSTENLSGYPGAVMILLDPKVEAAVVEVPRKGLIVFGHPCDRYDVAALLNVSDDHVGVDGVAEVLERAVGAVVVNAEDELCMGVLSRAGTDRHILVARDAAVVAEHRGRGGEAVVLAERDGQRWIVLCAGARETALMPVGEVPATMGDAMFAAGLAWAQGIEVGVIRWGLASFGHSVQAR